MAGRNDMRDSLIMGLGKRSDLSDSIETEIQLAQKWLEHRGFLPWFLLQRRHSTTLISGNERVQLPDRWLREYDGKGGAFEVQADEKWYELRKFTVDVLDDEFGNAEIGRPKAYAIIRNEAILAPIPDDDYPFRIRTFYQGATVLDSDIDNDWTDYGFDLLMAATGWRMAMHYLKNPNLKADFESRMRGAEMDLRMYAESREQAGSEKLLNETIAL